MRGMIEGLKEDLVSKHADRVIRSLVVKLKFADFEKTTAERAGHELDHTVFEELLTEAWKRGNNRAVRLLGVGIRFEDPKEEAQMEFFG
jgi:DNA polymerase-4